MAGFQGFEGFDFDSSADIKAEFDAGLQQALTSGDQHQMRSAIVQQAANTLSGGSPEFRQAKKREQVLADAMAAGNDRSEALGETDELATEIVFYEEAQKAAIDAELPEMAMTATMQLSKLRLVQEERDRLRTAESRAAAQEARDAESHELQTSVDRVTKRHLTNGLLVNPDDLSIHGRYDLTNPEDVASMVAAQKENERLVFRTEGDFVELTEAEKDRKARIANMGMGIAGRSTLFKKFFEKTQAADAFGTAADDFADLLLHEDAPEFFAAGGRTKSLFQRAGAHVRSFLGDDGMDAVEGQFAEDARWNSLSEEKQALMLELGYTLATAREGGRLTDQDVDRAIKTLGLDNPDPRAVAWIFGRALTRTRDTYERSLVTGGVGDDERAELAYTQTLAGLNSTLDRLSAKYKLDFEDDELFDRLINPTADNANLDDEGVNVRLVSPDNRGPRRRVVD